MTNKVMLLDITKKPGDPAAVRTLDQVLAENAKMRALVKKYGDLKDAAESAKRFVDDIGSAALAGDLDQMTVSQVAASLSGRLEKALEALKEEAPE